MFEGHRYRGAALAQPSWGRALLVFVLGMGVVAAPNNALAQRTSEVFTPAHRIAEEMLEVAEAGLGDEGKVVVDGARNSLVLFGSRELIEQTLHLLRRQDQAPALVRVRYRSLDLRSMASSGLDVAWAIAPGVGIGRVARDPSRRVSGRLYQTKESSDFAGELMIQSGQAGEIGRGRSVPLLARDRFDRVVSGFAEAERGFSARPRVLGDGRIRLEITNSNAKVDDRGVVDFAGATTTIVVESGETVAIGSFAEGSERKQRDGTSYSTRANRDDRVFLVTLEIVTP